MINIDDYLGRSGSWHRAGRSSRLVEARLRLWLLSYSSRLQAGAQSRGEESRNKTMISGR